MKNYQKCNALLLFLIIQQLNIKCQLFIFPDNEQINDQAKTNTIQNNRDLATCVCDLTAEVCDALCCCDSSCLSSHVQKWKDSNVCLKETNIEYFIRKNPDCHDLFKNPQDPTINLNQVNSFGCILYDNRPYQGYFYQEKASQGTMPLSSEYNNNRNDFSRFYSTITDARTSTSPYKPKSDIYVKILNENQEIIYDKIKILTADIYGNCNYYRSIQIFSEFTSACDLQLSLNTAGCSATNIYSSDYKYKNIEVVVDGGNPVASFPDGKFIKENLKDTSLITSGTTCTCQNTLTRINFSFGVNGNVLNSLNMAFKYDDVTGTCGDIVNVKKTFQVTFSISSDNSNLLIPLSGTPGYTPGYQLLVGEINRNILIDNVKNTAINRPVHGYQIIISDSDGQCLPNNAIISEQNQRDLTVKFKANFEIQCQIKLSYRQYQDACFMTNIYQNYKIRDYFFAGNAYIGRYGVANYQYIQDWVQVDSGTYFQRDRVVCPKTPFKKVITVFYCQTGGSENLQYYVIKVEENYVSNDVWKWQKSITDTTVTQSFQLSFEVIFVYVSPQDLSQQTKGSITTTNLVSQFFGGFA